MWGGSVILVRGCPIAPWFLARSWWRGGVGWGGGCGGGG